MLGSEFKKYKTLHNIWRVLYPGLWIRIQSLMLETNTDPDPIRIQGFNDQKLKKNYSRNFFLFFFDQTLQFTYP